jgi:hypothetical protein
MRLADWLDERLHDDLRAPGVLGWAWATVDLERALAEAGDVHERTWSAVKDELLGARGVLLLGSEPQVVLLEPSTEGWLAGWLARHGEGEAAVYRDASATPKRGSGSDDRSAAIQRPRATALGRRGLLANTDHRSVPGVPLDVLVEPPQ